MTVDPALFQRLDDALIRNRLSFRVCYCSSLDECWVGDLLSIETHAVKACSAPAHPYHSNAWPQRAGWPASPPAVSPAAAAPAHS